MAMTINDPGYFNYVHDIIKQEFNRIGVKLLNVNIEQNYNPIPIQTLASPQPTYMHGRNTATMLVEFMCTEKQFPYLKPFCNKAVTERVSRELYSDVSWGPRQATMWNPDKQIEYEVDVFMKCEMALHLGGSMDSFVDEFRKTTDKLFYAMESKAFDEEVDKMLANKDEYNN